MHIGARYFLSAPIYFDILYIMSHIPSLILSAYYTLIIVLVVLKIVGVISSSWWLVLSPLWIPAAVLLLLLLIVVFVGFICEIRIILNGNGKE